MNCYILFNKISFSQSIYVNYINSWKLIINHVQFSNVRLRLAKIFNKA